MKTAEEMLGRMEAFVRKCEELSRGTEAFFGNAHHHHEASLRDEARAIVAELPEPVDPDLLEARGIAAKFGQTSIPYANGNYDHYPMVVAALAAIKRGREMEREGR